jgi:hypothetical protein
MSQNNVVYTLREPYAAGSGQIRLDLNAQLVDEMDSADGWSNSGTGSGSRAYIADTSNKVHGTGSIKITLTNYTGEQHVEKTVGQFSIKDSAFRVSVWPSTLVNVNHLRVVLGNGTSTNRARFFVPAAQLSANVWNVITIRGDDAPDETAGTWDASNINFVALSIVTSSSQTLTCNWDYAVTVDLPENIEVDQQHGLIYPHRQDIYDDSYKSDMCLMSEGTGQAGRGIYTLETPLTDINSKAQVAYSDTSATVSKFKELVSSNGTGTIPVLSGNAQKWVVQRSIKYLPDTLNNKTLQAAVNFNPTKQYKITSLPNTSTIILNSDTDDKAQFPAADVTGTPTEILAYNLINNKHKKFTLSAAASYSSPNLTLSVNESTAGLDTSTWYAIKSPILSARVEDASQAGALVRANVVGGSFGLIQKFADNFNRANTSENAGLGGIWSSIYHWTNISLDAEFWSRIYNNMAWFGVVNSRREIIGNYVPHRAIAQNMSFRFDFYSLGVANNSDEYLRSREIGVSYGCLSGNGYDNGWYVGLKSYRIPNDNNMDCKIIFKKDGIGIGTADPVYLASYNLPTKNTKQYNVSVKISFFGATAKVKVWEIGSVEPNVWNYSFDFSSVLKTGSTWGMMARVFSQNGEHADEHYAAADFLEVAAGQHTIRYSLSAQSGNKLTAAVALPIADSANESPSLSGIAGYLG